MVETGNDHFDHTNLIVSSISTWKSFIFYLILQFKGIYEKKNTIPVVKQLQCINIGQNLTKKWKSDYCMSELCTSTRGAYGEKCLKLINIAAFG